MNAPLALLQALHDTIRMLWLWLPRLGCCVASSGLWWPRACSGYSGPDGLAVATGRRGQAERLAGGNPNENLYHFLIRLFEGAAQHLFGN